MSCWDGLRARLRFGRPARGGLVTLAAGFLLHLSLGCGYSYGNFTTYLTSYLAVRRRLPVDFGATLWVDAAMTAAEGPGVFLGSICYRRLGPRLTLLAGGVLSSGALALMYVVVDTSLAWVIVVFGVVNGLGVGLAYSPPLLAGFKWFPHHRGLISGLVVTGFRLGGIMFTTIQTSFLNPDNVLPDPDDGFFYDDALLDRVPCLFLLEAAVSVVFQLIGVLGVHDPPAEHDRLTPEPGFGRALSDTSDTSATAASEGADPQEDRSKTPASRSPSVASAEQTTSWKKSLMTLPALQLTVGFAMCILTLSIFNPLWKAFGQTFIRDDHFMELVGSGSLVLGLIGRLVWGVLCDMFSYKPIMLMMPGLICFFTFTLPACTEGSQVMFLFWVWSIYFCYAGVFSVVVTGTADWLGTDVAGHVYGVIFMTGTLVSLLAPPLADAVLDSRGYPSVFLVSGGFAAVAFVAALTFRHIDRTDVDYHRMQPDMPVKL
ncbi:MFS-type transporter AFUA_1G00970-like [Amphibalanus amphitrite]|uniref:MFS-type transporter AFUA_1G00970-like n=1 Tax=Amphibalanus amphitrite TaxID=1232801 RepID=UPI001C90ED74|nr:MFS-type transporter AFUA_1G00970-like [Amphibalanus amphitrite]